MDRFIICFLVDDTVCGRVFVAKNTYGAYKLFRTAYPSIEMNPMTIIDYADATDFIPPPF